MGGGQAGFGARPSVRGAVRRVGSARYRTQTHQEDGGALNLVDDSLVHGRDLVGTRSHANTLAAAALGGLDHDGVAHTLRDVHGLLC
eukprot:scaffold15489_cov23-Tisochrysis_lutea.AAC.2